MNRLEPHGVRASVRPAIRLAAVAGLALAPSLAFAAEEVDAEAAELSAVEVKAGGGRPDSPKYTSAAVDTPQTITMVPKKVIEAQNLMTLRDVLSTVPGITFGAGEGGGGYGDSINLRGYAASSDITVDGVRDSAQYTRSDPFNIEQIEVTNGANGVYSGSGSVGGSINIVSKRPRAADAVAVSAGVGGDRYYRATLDANHGFGDQVAGRLNAMVHSNDVPGRDVERFRRWGLAPALTFGLMSPTQATLGWFRQHDDNVPQYGIPFALNNFTFGVLPGVDRRAYYGLRNVDAQVVDVNALTAEVEHRFSDTLKVRNLARRQTVEQLSIVDQPQGTFCLPNGTVAAPASLASAACAPADTFTRNVSGTTRKSRNTSLYDQADLTASFATGPFEHSLDIGFSLMRETFRLDNGAALRAANGAAPPASALVTRLSQPDSLYVGPVNFIQSGAQDGERRNRAIYLFDTIKLSPRWELNGGVRYERNAGSNRTDVYNTTVGAAAFGTVTPGVVNRNSETLFSYRAGLVFKPAANASLYLAYGNALTPSQTAVNGGCTQTMPPPAAGNSCNVDPERAINYELGGKWDALGGRLSLTASVFRNERSNYRVASNEPGVPDQVLDGRSRVDGVTLGAAGRLTERWSIFANYTHLDSEVVRGKSRFCIANPAAAGCPAADADPTGRELTNTPNDAASLWTTLDLPGRVQLGYGLTWSGSYLLSNTITPRDPVTGAVRPLFRADGYVVHRAMIAYEVSRRVDLRLNVNNLTDEVFLQRIRNSAQSWATPGEARNAVLTLNLRY